VNWFPLIFNQNYKHLKILPKYYGDRHNSTSNSSIIFDDEITV